jgi:hypothetical protein
LGNHQHHERAHCPSPSHSGLVRQRDDCLGRRLFEHRRAILRTIWLVDANSNPNGRIYCYTYIYSNSNCDSYTHIHRVTYMYARNGRRTLV